MLKVVRDALLLIGIAWLCLFVIGSLVGLAIFLVFHWPSSDWLFDAFTYTYGGMTLYTAATAPIIYIMDKILDKRVEDGEDEEDDRY